MGQRARVNPEHDIEIAQGQVEIERMNFCIVFNPCEHRIGHRGLAQNIFLWIFVRAALDASIDSRFP